MTQGELKGNLLIQALISLVGHHMPTHPLQLASYICMFETTGEQSGLPGLFFFFLQIYNMCLHVALHSTVC